MNKLNKQITKIWLKDQDSFLKLKKFWSEKMIKREKLNCKYHILYKILIGRDWTTGLSNEYDYNYIFGQWSLNHGLALFHEFIILDKAEINIKSLVNNYQIPYKAEACQKIMSIQ